MAKIKSQYGDDQETFILNIMGYDRFWILFAKAIKKCLAPCSYKDVISEDDFDFKVLDINTVFLRKLVEGYNIDANTYDINNEKDLNYILHSGFIGSITSGDTNVYIKNINRVRDRIHYLIRLYNLEKRKDTLFVNEVKEIPDKFIDWVIKRYHT